MKSRTLMKRSTNAAPDQQTNRKRTTMMECALTLPVLMILVLGILEVGSGLRASTILQSACRESGRLTAMDWRYIVHDGQTPN